MGKGDKKTPKGKRYAGSYGNARPHKATTSTAVATKAPVVVKKAAATRKKAS